MLSLSKILLTIAIIVAVFYFGRLLTRRADSLMRKPDDELARRKKRKKNESVELAKCPRCDIFIGPDSTPCDRPDCPNT